MSAAAENIDKAFISNVSKLLVANSIDINGLEVKPFASGGNNRVFKLRTNSDNYLLKHYYTSKLDKRNRLRHEWKFLKYSESKKITCVPKPIACQPDENIAIYEFIEGHKLLPSQIDIANIQNAAEFIRSLNTANESIEASSLPTASEACFSIAEHDELVSDRIKIIKKIDMHSNFQQILEPIIQRIELKYTQVRSMLKKSDTADEEYNQKLSALERCISPSDFGFHNALRASNGKLYFIDFEYAGWDDPAKMIADFFCQPEVPVSNEYLEKFASMALAYAPESIVPKVVARVQLLMPLLQLKWCCIMLNEFLPDAWNRRKFAHKIEDETNHYMDQINKVENALKNIE